MKKSEAVLILSETIAGRIPNEMQKKVLNLVLPKSMPTACNIQSRRDLLSVKHKMQSKMASHGMRQNFFRNSLEIISLKSKTDSKFTFKTNIGETKSQRQGPQTQSPRLPKQYNRYSREFSCF